MAVEDAKKVLAYAIVHRSFRAAFRNDPLNAIKAAATNIGIQNPPTVDELDALVSFSDQDFDAFARLSQGLGDSLSGEHGINAGGVIW